MKVWHNMLLVQFDFGGHVFELPKDHKSWCGVC
jgi:hypothetical protein